MVRSQPANDGQGASTEAGAKRSAQIEEDFSAEPNYSKLAEGKELNLHQNLKWTIWENISLLDDTA